MGLGYIGLGKFNIEAGFVDGFETVLGDEAPNVEAGSTPITYSVLSLNGEGLFVEGGDVVMSAYFERATRTIGCDLFGLVCMLGSRNVDVEHVEPGRDWNIVVQHDKCVEFIWMTIDVECWMGLGGCGGLATYMRRCQHHL